MLNTKKIIILSVVGVIVLIGLFNLPVVVVNAGNRGVVFNNGTGVEDRIMGEGVHLKTPFIEQVKQVSVRTQTTQRELLAGSAENQSVKIVTSINWHLNASEVNKFYQEIGNDDPKVLDSLIVNRVDERIKLVVSQIPAAGVLQQADKIKIESKRLVAGDLLKYHIVLDDIVINDIDYLPAYNAAIEAKAKAEQDAQAEKNKLEAVRFQAEQQILTAKAEAESIRIKGEALKDNQQLVQLNAVERWNGVLPTYMMGSTVPFLNLK